MNGLEDLVRQTLAERAHDVDRVQLNAPTPCPAGSRRWVAVGTVVAVAAAILVAVVLVAPWNSDHRSTTPATAVDTGGTRSVSFHGITLTVPGTWAIGRLGCSGLAGSAGRSSVTVEPSALPNCPAFAGPPAGATPPPVTTTAVTVRAQIGGSATGSPTTVAGHPAQWVVTYGPESSTRFLRLPDVGVELAISVPPGDATALQRVLDGIAYTPVDALGCAARLPEIPVGSVSPVATGATTATVCEYDRAAPGQTPTLLGSRVLDPDEIDAVRRFVDDPDAGGRHVSRGSQDFLVYRFTAADGSVTTLAADPGATATALPGAYRS